MKKETLIKELKRLLDLGKEDSSLVEIKNSLKIVMNWLGEVEEPFYSTSDNSISSVGDYSLPSEINNHPGSVIVFSDGACRGNPGPGAWGTVAQVEDHKFIFQKSGVEFNTTNNQMELLGAIEGLNSVLENEGLLGKEVILISDSRYVLDGLKTWISGWKKRGWKKSDGKAPENLDLWKRLDELNQQLNGVHLYWVKGHSGHPQNELCDQLANEALDDAVL